MTEEAPMEYAAIDLGSNSFHMVVAVENEHGIGVIDRVREMVRLASGLDDKNRITEEAQQRALECLARFGERLRGLDEDHVRIVGTNTLRKAKNSVAFINQAEEAVGYPIEIISGIEEARLIYQGVAYALQEDRGRKLVIDIGGGSTELIVGDRDQVVNLESLYMGCVSYSQRFFNKGKYTPEKLRKAILAAQLEIEPHKRQFKKLEWQDAIGSSGTARAIERVSVENGWSESGITIAAIEQLLEAIVSAGELGKLKLAGLGDERKPVFVGGVAVMAAIFRSLKIKQMRISDGSLREGVLTELVGCSHERDTRASTVTELVNRYHIDSVQAGRVQETAYQLFEQVQKDWQLLFRHMRLLGWAAQLSEIGLSIAHSQYHKHGAYVLQHMDLPGFSRQEQGSLSVLVHLHRRKFDTKVLEQCETGRQDVLMRLAILLRISVLLNRGRDETSNEGAKLVVKDQCLKLVVPKAWKEDRPLTITDLEQEQGYLNKAGICLNLKYK